MGAVPLGLLLLLGLGMSQVNSAIFHHEPYKQEPIPYKFSYGVRDDYTGTHFDQTEKSDGDKVLGSYTVQLPDGRKQIVQYEADHHKGFIAKVTYKGRAQYPPHGHPAVTFPPQIYH